MSRYIPMPAYPDKMPVDISFVFEDEKPAGKHGFCKADGESLRFEDGTLARFWGVNVNGGACFPDKDYAPEFARRLAQAGCNIVRFHQLDSEWNTPNIFSYTKGRRLTTTRKLDPTSMDCLDYLIYCLKEEGIYCYMDMMTYRKFKEGDGVVDVDQLSDLGKPWCLFDRTMIELQKEFCTQIWTHYNPYTKLEYKDDPVFVLTEISNECDLFSDSVTQLVHYEYPDYYANQYRQLYKAWLEKNGLEGDWEHIPVFNDDEVHCHFKIELTKAYYKEMAEHMRSLGVKIPIAGTNWSREFAGNSIAHENMDFTDSHNYTYDWRWGNNERLCKNMPITAMKGVWARTAYICLPEKPFFMSEWDMPWPNSFRAESPIYYAAVGALQNWSGFAIHTYSYSNHLSDNSVLGRELSTPVAGVPYREGIFSAWNDPAKFGLFYHAALILRRSDVTPAEKKIAVKLQCSKKQFFKAYDGLMEQHKVSTVFDDNVPEGYERIVDVNEEFPHPKPGMICSDNGQLWRDLTLQIGAVDTPRTKVVYGALGRGANCASHHRPKNKSVSLNGMEVTCLTDFAVIAASSLTDVPIEESDNILLSTIGRARNTDAIFDGEKLLDVGKPPIMAEVIDAEIRIKTKHGRKMKVWGVNAEGYYSGQLMTTYEDGMLSFHVGDSNNPACYYLIVKE